MEVRKRLLGAFSFAKVSNFGKVHTVKRECSDAKTKVRQCEHTGRCELHRQS